MDKHEKFNPKDSLFGKFQMPGVVMRSTFSTITSQLAYHATIMVAFNEEEEMTYLSLSSGPMVSLIT